MRGDYYDGFTSSLWVEPQEYGAKFLTDVEAGYFFMERPRVVLGVNNVFDVFPDRMNETNQLFDVFQYPRASPFGLNGREVYLRTTLRIP